MVLFVVMVSMVPGCNQQTRYKTLTFFFTGVPSPEDERKKKESAQQAEAAMNKKKGEESQFSSHSYFTSKKCGECHQTSFTQSFGRVSRTAIPTMSFGDDTATGTTRLPLKKVCVNCHENRTAAFASANNLWLHAPVTKNNCIVCHTPHQSKYPDLLKDTTEKLCTMCHSEGLIRLTKSHQELKDCLECHTAHLGKDKFLLVKDYKEIRLLPDPASAIPHN